MNKAFERLSSKYGVLKQAEGEFLELVWDFFEKMLLPLPNKVIYNPVNARGDRFAVKLDDEPVTAVYIDDFDEHIIIETEYEVFAIHRDSTNLTNEEIHFVCECMQHYFED